MLDKPWGASDNRFDQASTSFKSAAARQTVEYLSYRVASRRAAAKIARRREYVAHRRESLAF